MGATYHPTVRVTQGERAKDFDKAGKEPFILGACPRMSTKTLNAATIAATSCLSLAACFWALIFARATGNLSNSLNTTNLSATEILSADGLCVGSPQAGFKLVMFGDYECEPCRSVWPEVVKWARQTPNVAVYFRNFPLTNLHPLAFRAATLAEVARSQGRFMKVHEQFFSESLTSQTLAEYETQFLASGGSLRENLKTAARSRVLRDMTVAASLGLEGTPSFFVVDPEGKVFRATSIGDVFTAVKR